MIFWLVLLFFISRNFQRYRSCSPVYFFFFMFMQPCFDVDTMRNVRHTKISSIDIWLLKIVAIHLSNYFRFNFAIVPDDHLVYSGQNTDCNIFKMLLVFIIETCVCWWAYSFEQLVYRIYTGTMYAHLSRTVRTCSIYSK